MTSSTNVSFTYVDPNGLFKGYLDVLDTNLRYAWSVWDTYFVSNPDASIELTITAGTNTNILAEAASLSSGFLGNNVFVPSVGYEFIYGIDANGSTADGNIIVTAPLLSTGLLNLDPTVATLSSKLSLAGTMIHEIGHMLGFGGWFNAPFSAPFQALVDTTTSTFIGANAVATYGGPVPLEGDYGHLKESVFTTSVMTPVADYGSDRNTLSDLEVAIFKDLGFVAAAALTDLTVVGDANNNLLLGTSADDKVNGMEGIDTFITGNARADAVLSYSAGVISVAGTQGSDVLQFVERVKFNDISVAYDLSGNAGTVAKVLGAVFGVSAVSNKEYVGIGLHYLDQRIKTYDTLIDLAFSAAGKVEHRDIVETLYANLKLPSPSESDVSYYTGLLDDKTYTVGQLGVIAADLPQNLANIGIVGLQSSGLDYIPV